jgi:hypothetical protein
MVPTCLPDALRKSWTKDVPLEYWIMQSELGLRGVVVFVDQSCGDGFPAGGSRAGHVPDGLRLDARRPLILGLAGACGRCNILRSR